MKLIEKILNIIFPPMCGICGKIGEFLCNECLEKLQKHLIEKQNQEEIYFVYKYEDIIRELLIKYKFNDYSYLYKTFTTAMLKNKKACNFIKKYDIIVPVPLHTRRRAERGYNQSELIAKELIHEFTIKAIQSKSINKMKENIEFMQTKIELGNNILIKNKNIKPQSTQNLKHRIENVKNAYEIKNKQRIFNKNVLLLDDIYTTGSTCNECKKVIMNARSKKSWNYNNCERLY